MKFGVREICDVTFKATAANQRVGKLSFKKYQPVFKIDTATTSEMTQESTTVYVQGGKGYNRLIAWEGEKTMTFTVTDALMSPMGLAVLTGAGLIPAAEDNLIHVHSKYAAEISKSGDNYVVTVDHEELAAELGIAEDEVIEICLDVPTFATLLDGSGATVDWFDACTWADEATDKAGETEGTSLLSLGEREEILKLGPKQTVEVTLGDALLNNLDKTYEGWTAELDLYVVMAKGATEVTIEPDSFGGYFYVEADTLFRREDNGQDMAAVLTFHVLKYSLVLHSQWLLLVIHLHSIL